MELKQESFEKVDRFDSLNEGDTVHIFHSGVLYLNRVLSLNTQFQIADEEQSYPITLGTEVFLVEPAPVNYKIGDLVNVTEIQGVGLDVPTMGVVTSFYESDSKFKFYMMVPNTHPQIIQIKSNKNYNSNSEFLIGVEAKVSGPWTR